MVVNFRALAPALQASVTNCRPQSYRDSSTERVERLEVDQTDPLMKRKICPHGGGYDLTALRWTKMGIFSIFGEGLMIFGRIPLHIAIHCSRDHRHRKNADVFFRLDAP